MRLVFAAFAALCLVSGLAPARAQSENTDADMVVARVGDQEVRMSEIMSQVMGAQHDHAGGFDEAYEAALNQRIDQLLVTQAAIDAGLGDTPMHAHRMRLMEQRLLAETFVQREVARRVDDAAVAARYQAMGREAAANEEIHARHMLVETEAEAAALKQQIDDGADFVTLAKSLPFSGSEDGGDLGYFTKGDMVDEIADVAYALATGAVSGPVKSAFGWHVIMVEDRRAIALPPFDEMRQKLRQDMSREFVEALIGELRATTTVTRFGRDGEVLAPDE